ncbi:MAG: thioredoxin family protein [Armatimonadota bacterium]
MKRAFILIALLAAALSCSADVEKTVKQAYPLLSGPLSEAKLVELPEGVLLRAGEVTVTQKDLDAEIGEAPEELKAALKNNALFMLEQVAVPKLLEAEAKSWAEKTGEKSPDLIPAYFDSLVSGIEVTDAEAQDFYEQNKDMFGGATFDQVKEMLKEYMLDEKRQAFVDSYIDAIGTRTPIEASESWVAEQYPSAIDNPVDKARTSGMVTLVDFGADGCQACEMMAPVLEELKTEYASKINMVLVNTDEEPILAVRYRIRAIPVQAFFDKAGTEVFRHVGFFPKEQIAAKLAEIGVE